MGILSGPLRSLNPVYEPGVGKPMNPSKPAGTPLCLNPVYEPGVGKRQFLPT